MKKMTKIIVQLSPNTLSVLQPELRIRVSTDCVLILTEFFKSASFVLKMNNH